MKAKILRLLLFLLAAVCALSMAALADGDAVWRSGDGESYPTISEAIQHNPLYGTITLLEDAEGEAIDIPANDRMTVDFGGYTYTVAAQESMFAVQVGSGSAATLKNGKLVGTGALSRLIFSQGALTVDGVTLTAAEDVQLAMIYATGGSVTIRGATGILTDSYIVQSASGIPVSIQDGVFFGMFDAADLSITGGQFANCGELTLANGYRLDEETGCVVPVGGSCTEHDFGGWTSVDENTHTHTCKQCGFAETVPHSYGAPVFDWSGDGLGGVSAVCRLRCRDCGHTILIPIPDASVKLLSQESGKMTYMAAYQEQLGNVSKTYRSYLTVRDSYSVTLNGAGDSYPYGATATLEIPDAETYYDFYEDGVLVAERATAIEVTVTRDRHFTAEPHTAQEAAPVHVSTPLKSGNKWDVTLMWAIPDGGSHGAEAPTLVEAGLYYLYLAEAPDAEALIRDGKQVVAPVGEEGALNGSFTLTAEVSAGNTKTMYALGYVIYQTGDTRSTEYTAVAVGTAADTN